MGLRAIRSACRQGSGAPGTHAAGVAQASKCLAASIASLLLVAIPGKAQQARDDAAVATQEVIETIRSAGRSRVILRLAPAPGTQAGMAGRFAAASAAVRTALPEEQRLSLSPLAPDLSVAELSADELQKLVEQGLVAEVVLDRLVPVALAESTHLVNVAALEAEPLAENASARRHAVAVLDTGFDLDHPFIQGSIVRQACFSSTVPDDGTNSLCPNGRRTQTVGDAADACDPASLGPLCDHGTMVAGIIAGATAEIMGEDGTSIELKGVSPGTPLIAIQVFSRVDNAAACGAFGYTSPCLLSYVSDQIRALRFVSALRDEHDIVAVNMSLSFDGFSEDCARTAYGRQYAPEISFLAAQEGIATVVAAGNEGSETLVGMPGCLETAVTVAATDDSGAIDTVLSNFNQLVDLVAPGVDITSSAAGSRRFRPDSGTSFAAPHVSGALAALKDRLPDLGVADLVALLRSSGIETTHPGNGLAAPRIDLAAALEQGRAMLLAGASPPPAAALLADAAAASGPDESAARFLFAIEPGLVPEAIPDRGGAPDEETLRQSLPDTLPAPEVDYDQLRGTGTLTFPRALSRDELEALEKNFPGEIARDRFAAPLKGSAFE